MKFKAGDKIVCVDNEDINIQLYQTYVIDSCVINSSLIQPFVVLRNVSGAFAAERFITFEQFRKQKIEKLLKR